MIARPESLASGPESVPTTEQVIVGIGGGTIPGKRRQRRSVVKSANVPNILRDADMVIPDLSQRPYSASEVRDNAQSIG